jgi:hypothetical protein
LPVWVIAVIGAVAVALLVALVSTCTYCCRLRRRRIQQKKVRACGGRESNEVVASYTGHIVDRVLCGTSHLSSFIELGN